jgi:multidrug efflux system membrane fusion protein
MEQARRLAKLPTGLSRCEWEDMDEQTDRPRPETTPRTDLHSKLTSPQRVKRRGVWRWLVAFLIVLLLAIVAWRVVWPMLGASSSPARSGRAGAAGPPQPVGTATAATGDVRVMVAALGTVTPLATVTVKTQLAGQLQQIGFTEGQLVHKGDFLAQIDPRPYQAALAQDQGQLAKDQALLKQAQVDLVRYQTLLRQDSIARQQADDQVYLVQQDQGAIQSDQAQIDTQKLNLTYCRIVAPVDGRVGLRQVDAGNYVQTSDANGIVVITQLQPISVVFSIAEDNLPAVLKQTHAGAKLPVTAYDRANVVKLATGELATLDNQIDTTTGTVKLRAIFPNADESLFPNQFVNARLLVDTLRDVVTVPVAAIQRGAPGTYVYQVDASSTVAVKPVKLGVTDGDKVQIVSGLAVGDTVVVDGADRLRDGIKVTAKAATPPTATPTAADTAAPEAAGDPTKHAHRHRQGDTPAAETPAPPTTTSP